MHFPIGRKGSAAGDKLVSEGPREPGRERREGQSCSTCGPRRGLYPEGVWGGACHGQTGMVRRFPWLLRGRRVWKPGQVRKQLWSSWGRQRQQ